MPESNVSFASNVNIITSDPKQMAKGDAQFFSSVKDYYALKKLYNYVCDGSFNSYKYVWPRWQIDILCGDRGFNLIREDEEVLENNRMLDEEYGYIKYDNTKLYPLVDEMYLEYKESAWAEKTNGFWWEKGSGLFDYSRNTGMSLWKSVNQQVGSVPVSGGGTFFTSYISQEIERIKDAGSIYIPTNEADLSELDEKDPYYYIYQKTAGVEDDDRVTYKNKEADLYLQKYSIYSAFKKASQDSIIEKPIDENVFVDAGPGTGKTYTLMKKLTYMIDDLDVDPDSIMVLCFTNAAVAEIKKRKTELVKEGTSRGIRNVDVRTFHSFAWWLINVYNTEMTEEEGWSYIDTNSLSYDGSIIKATNIIRKYPDIVFGGWSHFIVDEIQDLTDVRARLVLEIIAGCLKTGCGITALGDSCQAIYDYNQQDVLQPMTSEKFYKSLFEQLFNQASMYKLTVNHRQTNSLISLTKGLREAILSTKIPEMKKAVKDLFNNMGHLSGRNISDSITEGILDKLAGDGKVCLLCRNNGQVLRLSSQLRKRGLSHIVNAYDQYKCYASWIGNVFGEFEKQQISKDEFITRYNLRRSDTYTEAQDTWDRLANLLKKPNNDLLGVEEIVTAVETSQIDDPVFHNFSDTKVIVSNIHRAKGREYNGVIVDQNFINNLISGRKTDAGEFKTLYVAVTRAKKQLYCAHLINSDIRIWQIFKTGSKRWVKFNDRNLKYMEIRSTDINKQSFLSVGNDNQRYILDNVFPGDEIILRKSKANEILRYSIVHLKDNKERVLGDVNNLLIDDLEAMIETDDSCQWPQEIREIYVTDVYTEIDYENDNKIWNWVDFCGIGHLIYDVY